VPAAFTPVAAAVSSARSDVCVRPLQRAYARGVCAVSSRCDFPVAAEIELIAFTTNPVFAPTPVVVIDAVVMR